MPDKKTQMWGGHPLLQAKDAEQLELAAAVHEFHHGKDRVTAEKAALDEYRRENHAKAAAHHLMGMRAAQASGSTDDAKKHYDMYGLHIKALGHEQHEGVPAEVKRHTEGENVDRAYNFKGHGADQFLVNTVKKSEDDSLAKASNLPANWPCAECGHDVGDSDAMDKSGKAICSSCVPLDFKKGYSDFYSVITGHGLYALHPDQGQFAVHYQPRHGVGRFGTPEHIGRADLAGAQTIAQIHHHNRGAAWNVTPPPGPVAKSELLDTARLLLNTLMKA